MKISVVIPTRHRNDMLAQCLERLAPGRQTLDASDYEVIVSDDGSESTAEQMIRERFPWARWVPGPGAGPGANRNCGARHARGEWLAFTDDDCLPSPGWLAAYDAALRPGVEVYEGKTTCEAGLDLLSEAPENLTGGNLWSCNFLIRAERFRALGGFDPAFSFWCEDMEFAERVRRSGLAMQFLPAAVVDHPPRPRPLGWRAGARWESRVLLWYKEGNQRSAWTWLPLHLLRFRLGQVRRSFPDRHALAALASIAGELACVITHLSGWDRKFRQMRGPRSRTSWGGARRGQQAGGALADSDA